MLGSTIYLVHQGFELSRDLLNGSLLALRGQPPRTHKQMVLLIIWDH